jgi:hypothetical protein
MTKGGDSLYRRLSMQNFIFRINQLILTTVMDREITIKKSKK